MESVNLGKIKKIHFIGIGGIGLSAIAKLMNEEGKEISGSDLSHSLITKKLEEAGIKVFIGQSEKNITDDTDLVIYTMAIKEDNPELKRAKELGIKTITYPKSLGLIFNDKYGIAVCGTHGKSTTVAMAGLLLEDAGFDPTIIVGSIVPRYNGNLRTGNSKYMVIEACEYEKAFLSYYPKIIVLNNIELDHTDCYKSIEDYISAFKEFIKHLSENETLICNGDSAEISNLKSQIPNKIQNPKSKNIYNPADRAELKRVKERKIVNFGLNKGNNVRAYDVKLGNGITRFKAVYNYKNLGEFVLKVPGLFNVYNSLGAIALGLALKIPVDVVKKSLAEYSGIWRRFETKGEYKEALVVSDYAHHPTAVKATIEAAREFYPRRRIVAVFQPHQHNRTKALYKNFLESFNGADILILSKIFDVAGREKSGDQNVSSLDLVNDIKKKLGNWEIGKLNSNLCPVAVSCLKDCDEKTRKVIISPRSRGRDCGAAKLNNNSIFYAKDLRETKKLIDKQIKSGDILLIMGAGDIYKLADNLTK